MSELPEGWNWRRLEDLAAPGPSAITDGPFGSNLKSADYTEAGARVIRLGNIGIGQFIDDARAFVSKKKFEALRKHEATEGDLVISALADPVGRSCMVPPGLGPTIVKADCIRFRPGPEVDGRFLMFALNSPQGLARTAAAAHGLGRLRVNLGDLRALPVPVPDLDVQRRIVAKLDALLAQTRAAREQLEAVPALVEKYRQSVLAAAFRGDLTAEWRKKNPNVEPASKLLERIRAERRKKWEEAELAKMKAKGKVPKDDKWKAKYVEPEPIAAEELPDLPSTWCWAPLGVLSTRITDGVHKKPSYTEEGIPFVTVKNLTAGPGISFEDLNHVSEQDHREFTARTKPERGDILVSKDGTLGVVRQIRTDRELASSSQWRW